MEALNEEWINAFHAALNGKYDSVIFSEKNSLHLACIGTLKKNGLFFGAQIRHGCTGYKDQYVLNVYCNKKLIDLKTFDVAEGYTFFPPATLFSHCSETTQIIDELSTMLDFFDRMGAELFTRLTETIYNILDRSKYPSMKFVNFHDTDNWYVRYQGIPGNDGNTLVFTVKCLPGSQLEYKCVFCHPEDPRRNSLWLSDYSEYPVSEPRNVTLDNIMQTMSYYLRQLAPLPFTPLPKAVPARKENTYFLYSLMRFLGFRAQLESIEARVDRLLITEFNEP